MDMDFCVAALEEALSKGRPEIFNTDQGSQFTSEAFTGRPLASLVAGKSPASAEGWGTLVDKWTALRVCPLIHQIIITTGTNGQDSEGRCSTNREVVSWSRIEQAVLGNNYHLGNTAEGSLILASSLS